jgi:hypothetical protein
MESIRRNGQWLWGAGVPMDAVEWHVGGRDRWKNVDVAFKKLDLQTLAKLATETKEKVENVVEKESSTVEEPWTLRLWFLAE